ncbi:MAG: hypothetical protein KF911_14400 [Pseudomonadales bacterium]|nr:hypothetical protein [Pseudomonadales bacterium]
MTRVRSLQGAAAVCILLLAAGEVLASLCLSNELPGVCNSLESCRAALEQDSLDAAARLALCDLHVERGELVDATVVLQRGLQLCTARRGLCNTMERALSNVEERRRAEERLRGPEQAARHREALRGYCLGPISTERTINACEELVASEPDGALLVALGGKLLESGQPARALAAARQARAIGGAPAELESLLTNAETRRSAAARRCSEQGDLGACDAALLAGERDEHSILRERGRILAQRGATEQALRALGAAFALSPGDRDTQELIAALRPADFPDMVEFHGLRAAVFETRGQVEAEIGELEAIARLDPTAREARGRLQSLREQIAAREAPVTEPRVAGPDRQTVAGPVGPTPDVVQREPPQPTFSNAIMADGRTH